MYGDQCGNMRNLNVTTDDINQAKKGTFTTSSNYN